MSYKKRQIIGFSIIVICVLTLVFTMLINLNTLNKNMNEIVEDRYDKVRLVLDIRQLFLESDREILYSSQEENQDKVESSIKLLQENHQSISKRISELKSKINTSKGKKLLQQLEDGYRNYSDIESQITKEIANTDENQNNLQFLMNQQSKQRKNVLATLSDFKTFQEGIMNNTMMSSKQTYDSMVKFTVILSLFSITLIILILLWMIRSISKNLLNIVNVIKTINYKDLTELPRINICTKDEIGEIANSFNEMAASLENYNRNEKALNQKMSDQNWVQTRLADMAMMYQRIDHSKQLAERVITKLVPMVGASLGAYYIRTGSSNDIRFVKLAEYAGNEDEIGRLEFRMGEGLIGQCANEKKSLMITNIPDDYRLITTGLGETKPKSILITPVVFEDEVVAVIEIASFETFTHLQQLFVKRAMETLGITVNNVLGRMEIERLLKESQAQTEELQVQSEELQAQSEELQTQAEELRIINEQLSERTLEAEEKSRQLEITQKDLEEQAIELKQSSKYKSEFLANMSHELRTPLNSILILSEMLQDPDDKSTPEERQEFARIIRSSGQDLLSLINNVLDLSKVEVGKLVVEFDQMNMSEIPEMIHRNFDHVAKNKGIDFIVEKENDIPDILFTDELRFQQILKNLLSNAFKFTDHGSVTMNIKRTNKELIREWVNPDLADTWIEIGITDTGIGIPKDKQQLIFEAFQQADGATIRKYGGTGLGLSISREFAKLLGGWIIVESEEGKGSTFTLFLPDLPNGINVEKDMVNCEMIAATIEECPEKMSNQNEETKQIEVPQTQNNMNNLSNKTILIVDDDHRNIFALKKVLESEGMEIISAENGFECLDILQDENEIDAVMIDIMMPGMDGYETMQHIRKMEQYKEMPIIALTAKAMKGDRAKCLKAGASDYISKPLKVDQLLSVLRVWLTKKETKK
ncbi:response regulator [Rummeliibacillus sp. JY-2-4R]